MKHQYKGEQVTLTTGPFHVPALNAIGPNDRLIVTLKNPTNEPLMAAVMITQCPDLFPPPPPRPGLPTFNFVTAEDVFAMVPMAIIPPMSCNRLEFSFPFLIPEVGLGTFRVTTKGDYQICNCQPICGKLEISVAGGTSRPADAPEAFPGLLIGDPNLLFRYENFVLCQETEPCLDNLDCNDCCCC